MTSSCNSNNIVNDFEVKYPWINGLLFEKLIRQDYSSNDDIVVEKYSLVPALKKGENYLSQMIRATVDYKVNESVANKMNFVIKAQLLDAPENMRQNEIFSREITAFKYVIPRAEELLKGIDDHTKFSAKCYEANSEKCYLVFEDLNARGYRNIDRQNGLNMDNFKSTFSILAKWHATTSILMETDDHIMRPFDNPFCSPFYEALVKTIIKTTAQYTREFEPDCEKLAIKLEAISDVIFQKIQKSTERISTEFNCLSHSDLWSNNVMFNDYLPSPSNALLIDFQMLYAGSPVLDLCYSLFSSSEESMREMEFDCLLDYYHDQFSTILQKLGYKKEIPTLDTLRSQMFKRGVYGVPLGILGTVGRYSEENDDNQMDLLALETQENKLYWYNVFRNPKCYDKIMFLLSYFDSKGLLDV